MAQPIDQRGEHFQCDIGIAPHKRKKMVAREHGQPRVLGNERVRRAVLTIKQRHIAEKIAAAQFSQSELVSVEGLKANPDFPLFNYVHRVSLLTVAEQKCPGLGIDGRQQLTQFVGRLVVEGFKQRYLAQCVDRHVRKANGTSTRIAAIRAAEKRELRPLHVDLGGFASRLEWRSLASFEP